MIMSLREWFGNREILLTGVTSELGRALLEKILRTLPNIRIFAVVRSRDGLSKDCRIKSIFASPGYERLRQQESNAIGRVRALEGNLLYEGLGLSSNDTQSLRKVEVVLHAAGPPDNVIDICRDLPSLKSVAVASSVFQPNRQHAKSLRDGSITGIPLVLIRLPFLGPAYTEPIPGFVEILRGPTALMVGAGFALGRSDLPAEVLPVDVAANAVIVAAWERGIRSPSHEPTVYDVPAVGVTWGELVEKGRLAKGKFSYPTFAIQGITSKSFFHWIVVFVFEWMPSALSDTILWMCGAKSRCMLEHNKVRKALRSLESIASRAWPVDRNRIYRLQENLTPEDRDTFSVCPEIDVESYVLCASASARKYCVNEVNLKIVRNFYRLFLTCTVILMAYIIFRFYHRFYI